MKLTQGSAPAAEAAAHSAATIVPGRLRWRCRRGMKELDVLLERLAQRVLSEASASECRLLGELLELPDPVLAGYLLGDETPAEPHLAQAIGRMRALCRLDTGSAVF
ncbi:MAG TPA: succinate dehydrogenase assembly factor 2 [Steroidobacteraceae bacterium]|jgi:antitoxin CptB|nr:succinate dehydrogenase assembly factor 2 [Steroidobacteraceae bacterium]